MADSGIGADPQPPGAVKAPPAPAEPKKKFKFPTAFTVLAAVLLLVWIASFFVPAGAYKTNARPGRRSRAPTTSCRRAPLQRRLRRRWSSTRRPRPARRLPTRQSAPGATVTPSPGVNVRRHVVHLPVQAALGRAAERPLRRGERRTGFVGPWEEGFLYGSAAIFFFVLAVGAFITVTMKTRGDPDRDRPARASLPAQRLGADRDPDGGLRARRDELRDVGGDARLLRPARAARARAPLRPDGRGGDHLPRRRFRRDRLDRQPVRDRRRVGRGRHQHRRRDRPADRAVDRARRASRSATSSGTRAAFSSTRRSRSSACRPPTPPTRRRSSATCRR